MIVEPGVHERLAATCICICSMSLMIIQTVPRNQAKQCIYQRSSPASHWAFPFIDYDTKMVLPPTCRNRPTLPHGGLFPCMLLISVLWPLSYVKNKKITKKQHSSCILGSAQRLEGSTRTRTNFENIQWIPLVLVLPESSGPVSVFGWCIYTLSCSLMCLYPT